MTIFSCQTNRIVSILLMEVQTSFMVLRTVTEMQNDVGMTSQIVYLRFFILFGHHFTKIHYKFDENTSLSFDENTSLSRKIVQNIIKRTILAVWSFLLLLPWQQYTNLRFAISFERSFVPQTQSIVSDINTCLEQRLWNYNLRFEKKFLSSLCF